MGKNGEDCRKKRIRDKGPFTCNGPVMSRSDKFQQIVASLHEAAIDPGGWSEASARIEKALEIRGTGIVCSAGNYQAEVRIFEAVSTIAG